MRRAAHARVPICQASTDGRKLAREPIQQYARLVALASEVEAAGEEEEEEEDEGEGGAGGNGSDRHRGEGEAQARGW